MKENFECGHTTCKQCSQSVNTHTQYILIEKNGQTKAASGNDLTQMKKLTRTCPVTDCYCEPYILGTYLGVWPFERVDKQARPIETTDWDSLSAGL